MAESLENLGYGWLAWLSDPGAAYLAVDWRAKKHNVSSQGTGSEESVLQPCLKFMECKRFPGKNCRVNESMLFPEKSLYFCWRLYKVLNISTCFMKEVW